VVDSDRDDIQKFNSRGVWSATFTDDELDIPRRIAVDSAGHIYVLDAGGPADTVLKFDPNGEVLDSFGSFNEANGIAIDSEGYIYVLDEGVVNSVLKFDPNGENEESIITWENPINGTDIAIDSEGYIYILDNNEKNVLKYNQEGLLTGIFCGLGTEDGLFQNPKSIAIDGDDNFYVADRSENKNDVQKFDSDGNFIYKIGTTGEGNGMFLEPWAIGIDRSDNSLYISDLQRNDIQKISPVIP
jgi:DNA-binding beta-propeller fold protein YncE